ncbi:hypothetical protein EDB80DRAFT_439089 [Ilyonectria destructans]|nr:hypothetical protein EDB80DRAFT_439089 [Ilyonectria destructans]
MRPMLTFCYWVLGAKMLLFSAVMLDALSSRLKMRILVKRPRIPFLKQSFAFAAHSMAMQKSKGLGGWKLCQRSTKTSTACHQHDDACRFQGTHKVARLAAADRLHRATFVCTRGPSYQSHQAAEPTLRFENRAEQSLE